MISLKIVKFIKKIFKKFYTSKNDIKKALYKEINYATNEINFLFSNEQIEINRAKKFGYFVAAMMCRYSKIAKWDVKKNNVYLFRSIAKLEEYWNKLNKEFNLPKINGNEVYNNFIHNEGDE